MNSQRLQWMMRPQCHYCEISMQSGTLHLIKYYNFILMYYSRNSHHFTWSDYTNERTFTDMMVRDWRRQSRKIKPKIFLFFVFLELPHMYQLLLLQELANQVHHKHFHLYRLCLEQSPCMLQSLFSYWFFLPQ